METISNGKPSDWTLNDTPVGPNCLFSVKGAATQLGRIARIAGPPYREAGNRALTRFFPTAADIAQMDMDAVGMPAKRKATLKHVADHVAIHTLTLDTAAGLPRFIDTMTAVPGIGPWTANYIAMRAFAEPDAFPASDLGIIKALQAGEVRPTVALASLCNHLPLARLGGVMRYDIFETTLTGPLILAGDDRGLQHLNFVHGRHPLTIAAHWHRDPGFFSPVRQQLTAYLAGARKHFDIELNLQGTVFQMRVWAALSDIPYGTVVSYQWVAKRIGNAAAVRAVGAANGRNPISIIVPCHRVVGKRGHLTGYGGGLGVKRRLLRLENPDLPIDKAQMENR